MKHNYSFETQYEVVVRAGRLPARLESRLPLYMSAMDQDYVSSIFDSIVNNDPNFKKHMQNAVEAIEDREDIARSREEPLESEEE